MSYTFDDGNDGDCHYSCTVGVLNARHSPVTFTLDFTVFQYKCISWFRVCVCVCIHRMKMVGSNREITYSPVHCGGNPKICLFVRSLFHTPIEYEHMSLRVCACVCVWIYYIHSLIHTFIIVLVYISIFGCIAICMILSRLLLVPTAVHSFFFFCLVCFASTETIPKLTFTLANLNRLGKMCSYLCWYFSIYYNVQFLQLFVGRVSAQFSSL